jgi:hypothetical protein
MHLAYVEKRFNLSARSMPSFKVLCLSVSNLIEKREVKSFKISINFCPINIFVDKPKLFEVFEFLRILP